MSETHVAEWWLGLHAGEYERIGRNVPVGLSPDVAYKKGGRAGEALPSRGAYRIDILAGCGSEVTVIEVKEVGNMTSIGQLISYGLLFQRCYQGFTRLKLLLVAARIPDTIRYICDRLGIGWAEAPESVYQSILARSRRVEVASSSPRVEELGTDEDVPAQFTPQLDGE